VCRILGGVIRVAVLDRHPAVRRGLASILSGAAGVAFVGAVGSARELPALVYRTDPDVVVVDDLSAVPAGGRARVLLYASAVSPSLVLAAQVAGAAGVVDKASDSLLAAVRCEAPVFPDVGFEQRSRAASRLDPRDRPIFVMRLAGTSPRDIASVVGMGVAALNARVAAIAGQLAPAF
jgi:DNA-binding NarL/FixJ family response regulator